MSTSINSLLEQKGTIVKQLRDLTDKADAEKRAMNTDETASFDKMDADLRSIEDTISKIQRMRELSKDQDNLEPQNTSTSTPGAEENEQRAWHELLLRGEKISEKSQAILEKRGTSTQIVGTAGIGGYLVPILYSNKVIAAMKAFGGVLGLANITESNTGATFTIPKEDTTSQVGALITETTADTVQDVSWTNVTIGSYMFTSNIIKMSWELLQDNIVAAESRLSTIMATRLGRVLAQYFTTGTGSSQPEGFVTGAGSPSVTTASATVATYDEIIDFIYSLNDAYKPGARLLFNNTTLKALRKFKDTTNRPLWDASFKDGVPDTIHGIPYSIVHEMADYGTTANKFMAYGDLSQAMYVRRVMGDTLTVFRELYAANRVNGYVINSRWDSKVVNASAIKVMAHA